MRSKARARLHSSQSPRADHYVETADAEAKELLKKIEAESEAKAAEEAEAAKAAEDEGDELVSN